MTMDFSALLVLLTSVSGVIWLLDYLFLLPRRKVKIAAPAPGSDIDEDLAESILKPSLLVDYARSFFPIFLIVLILRSFLIEPFRIPSNSMMPTLLTGDFILVNKFNYGFRLPVLNKKIIPVGDPQRGDVMVFRWPGDNKTPYIKRVVGLPGDKISYKNKVLYINGEAMPQEKTGTYRGIGSGKIMTGADYLVEDLGNLSHEILVVPNRRPDPREKYVEEFEVPAGEYFMVGDNRDNSMDSRFWKTVPDENIIGQAFRIWMYWDSNSKGMDWDRIGQKIN